jgi:hypothetical protein
MMFVNTFQVGIVDYLYKNVLEMIVHGRANLNVSARVPSVKKMS